LEPRRLAGLELPLRAHLALRRPGGFLASPPARHSLSSRLVSVPQLQEDSEPRQQGDSEPQQQADSVLPLLSDSVPPRQEDYLKASAPL
jgi:hypothetical protein